MVEDRDQVSAAFRTAEEDRERRRDPPFWERPAGNRSKLWHDVGVPVLIAILTATIGIAVISHGLGHW